jgi:hypothetical protein
MNKQEETKAACKPSNEWFEQEVERLAIENNYMKIIIKLLLNELIRGRK